MKTTAKAVVLMAGCLSVAIPASAENVVNDAAAQAPYQLIAVSDRAEGKAVLAGDYGTVIAKLSGQSRRFATQTNLCVAHTAAGDLRSAEQACATAVAISERGLRHAGPGSVEAWRRDLALALSNRGVVSAMRGDTRSAGESFVRAMELRADLNQAAANLRHLMHADPADLPGKDLEA